MRLENALDWTTLPGHIRFFTICGRLGWLPRLCSRRTQYRCYEPKLGIRRSAGSGCGPDGSPVLDAAIKLRRVDGKVEENAISGKTAALPLAIWPLVFMKRTRPHTDMAIHMPHSSTSRRVRASARIWNYKAALARPHRPVPATASITPAAPTPSGASLPA